MVPQWLFDRRELWAPGLIAVIVAMMAPLFPRWNAWLRTTLGRQLRRPRARGSPQQPMEVLRFIECHEPNLFAKLTQGADGFEPLSPAAIHHRNLDFWLEHGLPLLGKYGPRASDDALINLFRYFRDIGLRLHQRGDGSGYHYLTRNPLDVRIGSQVDPAFYPTADHLLGSLLFSAIGRPPQEISDGEALFASVVQRANRANGPGQVEDQTADPAAAEQAKAAQYLGILEETLKSGSTEAGAILRYLLAVTIVHPAASTYVVGGEPPDSALNFHEDDYCSAQLLPRSAFEFCAEELKTIATFAAAHRQGNAYTDIYMRKRPPHRLGDLGISLSTLSDVIGNKLPLRRLVNRCYNSHVERAPRTIGFGATSYCCLFAEFDETSTLQNAWLQLWFDNLAYYDAMRTALAGLGVAYDLIVVDWASADLFAINDRDALSRYLAKRLSPLDSAAQH
jgi:hypothetical protein